MKQDVAAVLSTNMSRKIKKDVLVYAKVEPSRGNTTGDDVMDSSSKEEEDGKRVEETMSNDVIVKHDGLLVLPLDALATMITYLSAKSLTALSSTCRTFYSYLRGRSCGTKAHFFSRVHNDSVQLVSSQELLDELLEQTLNTSSTMDRDNTLLTGRNYKTSGKLLKADKKKSKSSGKVNNSYPTYARFLEEAVTAMLEDLPPYAKVNGRVASVSPEHTVCRMGGGGRVGAGGSGCALWGVGKRGQLGNGLRTAYEPSPHMLRGGIGYSTIRIVQVSAGGGLVHVAHTLLLTDDGRVLSFGTGQYGQLGHGWQAGRQLPDETRPRYVDALQHTRIICISAGELHSAAVSDDGNLYTWGDSFCGQCGHGDKRPQLLPTKVSHKNIKHENCMAVSCGNRHTLVVTEDGDVFSFGLGHFGVLGRAYTPFEYDLGAAAVDPTIQLPIDDNTTEFQLTAAQMSHLDLLANCTLEDSSDQCIPVAIDSLSGIKIVGASAGHRHSLLLDENGVLYSCGAFLGGALGHGNLEMQGYPMSIHYFGKGGHTILHASTDWHTPILVENQIKITQFSAGVDISMAVSTEGDVYGWGKGKGGRIGLGLSDVDILLPRRIPLGEIKAIDVECGYLHSVIVGLNGSIFMCGEMLGKEENNTLGQHHEDSEQNECSCYEGYPIQVPNFNVWQGLPEPSNKVNVSTERWKKYGKYELQGRSKVMAESARWNV